MTLQWRARFVPAAGACSLMSERIRHGMSYAFRIVNVFAAMLKEKRVFDHAKVERDLLALDASGFRGGPHTLGIDDGRRDG